MSLFTLIYELIAIRPDITWYFKWWRWLLRLQHFFANLTDSVRTLNDGQSFVATFSGFDEWIGYAQCCTKMSYASYNKFTKSRTNSNDLTIVLVHGKICPLSVGVWNVLIFKHNFSSPFFTWIFSKAEVTVKQHRANIICHHHDITQSQDTISYSYTHTHSHSPILSFPFTWFAI